MNAASQVIASCEASVGTPESRIGRSAITAGSIDSAERVWFVTEPRHHGAIWGGVSEWGATTHDLHEHRRWSVDMAVVDDVPQALLLGRAPVGGRAG